MYGASKTVTNSMRLEKRRCCTGRVACLPINPMGRQLEAQELSNTSAVRMKGHLF